MLTTHRLHLRSARLSSRGGFTLVELLVVIGIIAILAGVALGPITNGIKKAKQSQGLTSAHSIGIATFSYANDNNQLFPDKVGGNADDVAGLLLAGGYVSDPSIFHLSADTNAGSNPLTKLNNTPTTIVASGVTSWDFVGNAGNGVDSTKYTFLPIFWTAVTAANAPTPFAAAAGTAITVTLLPSDPFGTDGVAVYYINNSAAFVTSTLAGATYSSSLVSSANNLGSAPASYTTLSGK